jgi:ABC-type dipeptide/oligopeptide/nickel transport system ATPase subunit
MLDVSIQPDTNLLRQWDERNTIICITHDLATAAYFTDRMLMYLKDRGNRSDRDCVERSSILREHSFL